MEGRKSITTTALLFIEVFALGDFALLADVERRNRAMVAHYAGPDLTRSPLARFDTVFL